MIVPKDVTMKQFAASLVVSFPTDNIPFLDKEENWKQWGNRLIQEQSFADNGAPSTDGFSNKLIWAQALFKTMASFA
jgi:hypothetical protein